MVHLKATGRKPYCCSGPRQMIRTAESDHGSRVHIIKGESLIHQGSYKVYCGHSHFDIEGEEYDSIDDVPNLCMNCKEQYEFENN